MMRLRVTASTMSGIVQSSIHLISTPHRPAIRSSRARSLSGVSDGADSIRATITRWESWLVVSCQHRRPNKVLGVYGTIPAQIDRPIHRSGDAMRRFDACALRPDSCVVTKRSPRHRIRCREQGACAAFERHVLDPHPDLGVSSQERPQCSAHIGTDDPPAEHCGLVSLRQMLPADGLARDDRDDPLADGRRHEATHVGTSPSGNWSRTSSSASSRAAAS